MKKIMAKFGFVAILGLVVIALSTDAVARRTIRYTRHNLSTSSLYQIKATSESQICIFCHAPHNTDSADTPLWNHSPTTATFLMASTPNVVAGRRTWMSNDQPTGISKKCLSCHDGTVAIGAVKNGGPTIEVQGTGGTPVDQLWGSRTQSGRLTTGNYGYIGTDLRGGHVISFNYYEYTEGSPGAPNKSDFTAWSNISAVNRASMFDRNRNMQCHTCHDPHNDWCDDIPDFKAGRDPLWRKPCDATWGNAYLCRICHKNMASFQNYSF